MPWPVEVTGQFESWYSGLGSIDREAVNSAVDVLEEHGPGLGRPLVGEIVGSRHGQLKELRIGSFASCSVSIRAGRRSSSSGATRGASGRAGIGRRSPRPMTCTTPTWRNCAMKAFYPRSD